MNKLKNLFLPTSSNNYSPVITRTGSIFVFALIVLFFNITYTGSGQGQVKAAVSINDIISLHNQERQSRGLGILTVNSALNYSAQKKAEAMLAADCWSHYCPDGKSPWEFFDEAGYVYVYAGENLAHGFYDSESAMIAWMNSPTHRANILKGEFQEVGIGIAYGDFQGKEDNVVIAVHFGTRQSSPSNIVTNTPVPTKAPVVNDKPEIVSPEEGAILGDNQSPIIGKSKSGERVEIYNENNLIGEIPVNGGLFTYRPVTPYSDGEQNITARSYTGDQFLGASDSRDFIIDTVIPTVINNQLTAKAGTGDINKTLKINLTTNEKIKEGKFVLDNVDYQFLSSGNLDWYSEILVDSINRVDSLTVKLVDLAGNSNEVQIEKGSIAGLSDSLAEVSTQVPTTTENPAETNLLGLSQEGLKSQINVMFVLISLAVILIDMIAARQTGLTGFSGKPHFHFSNFIVLLLIILIGGLNGQLLNGVSTNT